ncbi:MAG: cell division FtsZ family protein [Muribaculaceae bacterium]|nr:cell division FtsZ family protein [Muribaculaceae bacterium]
MTPEDPNLIEQYHNSPDGSVPDAPGIIAMGVGGGGCNAVAYMHSQGVRGVDFVVLNTDDQALKPLPVATKVLLGPKLCGGFGAGGKPEVGEAAAQESIPEIEKLLTPNVKMVFVTAGMGGGTGTGGAPVVAGVAKRKKILTVGIVTIPFFFEGMKKITSAIDGAARLQQNVDAMLVINNDRLGTIYPNMEWSEAFTKADDILTTAARTISDMVTTLANINIDMRDVDTCLRDGRTALISVGYGEGPQGTRMTQAIKNALHSPLLCDTDIMSAKELLFAFYISHKIDPPLSVTEATEANRLVEEINKHVHIKFGWGYDDTLDNKIKFTILASGFDVSVETGGSRIEVIEGNHQEVVEVEKNVDERIAAAYGKDKVEDFTRRQETQNYFVLTPEQLDDDEAIDMVESSPAFKRDKRKAAASMHRSEQARQLSQQSRQGDADHQQPQRDNSANRIFFSADDR